MPTKYETIRITFQIGCVDGYLYTDYDCINPLSTLEAAIKNLDIFQRQTK